MTESLNLIKSGIWGVIVGDSLGVPYEFIERSILDLNPAIDMMGYGTYNLPSGSWSDDSSLTLATLDSLTHGLNYVDMMQKFSNWLYNNEYTPYDEVFDVGNTTNIAISNFPSLGPLECGGCSERDNGNGSLMRILPIAYFIFYNDSEFNETDTYELVHNVSSLTHRHRRSMMACGIYIKIAIEILKSKTQNLNLSLEYLINKGIADSYNYYKNQNDFNCEIDNFNNIFSLETINKSRDEIRGSGYVLNSLESSVWCLLNTNSYKDAVLKAVNLGEDTDTTAAIAGGLAGLFYGYDDIPKDWLNQIAKFDYINDLITNFNYSLR